MKKRKLEIIIFIVNAIYMILELIASRILSPYFGSSNMIWTSVIGIILLSTSVGNYLGGRIADKKGTKENVKMILGISGFLILIIPIIQNYMLSIIISFIDSIKIGAIISTLILFFMPSMFIGMLSPIIIKLKMKDLENVGKTTGRISAIATLGSIIGTFIGGFYLVPTFGSNQILFVLAIMMFLLIIFLEIEDIKKKLNKVICFIIVVICLILFCVNMRNNAKYAEQVLKGDINVVASFDTQYGRAQICNSIHNGDLIRHLVIDKGNESATYIDEDKCYDLVYEYTKYYDLMFRSSNEIKDTLMIGGAGYSYPKYYISSYAQGNMDVVEIDEQVTEIAKKYFYLDKLIHEYDLINNKRLNLITDDGRVYLNKNVKKYDAILNDAFSGEIPAQTLTTLEAIEKIYNSLNKNGVYLTNIISSIEGENSKFIKAEVNTLKQVFKNVYVVPCNYNNDLYKVQNNMVIATDDALYFDETVDINIDGAIVLTDDYCPVESLVP